MRCNFSCKFCSGRFMKPNDLPDDMFQKIITLFPDTTYIELQGEEKITISIESPDPDKFRSIRGGNFDKVIQGIQLLILERNKRGQNRPVIGFSVTVLKDTQTEIPGIARLYNQLGLDGGIYIQPLQKMSST
jgi:MoaA/NifB/PqqE/SkfB family radical SAM enzyme